MRVGCSHSFQQQTGETVQFLATISDNVWTRATWFVKFVLKFIVVSEVSSIGIKLARDALKELIETNSSKYTIEVATH